jgi:hypothetical protein
MTRVVPSGKRDTRITMRRRLDVVDDEGAPDLTAVGAGVEVWASRADILPGPGFGELLRANQISARGDVTWVIAFRDEWDPARVDVPKVFHVEHEGRVYDITHVAVIGRRNQLSLTTLAKTG